MTAAAAKRLVLVTGGGRGLGTAIVRALAAAGHDVTFTYRSAAAEAENLAGRTCAATIQASHSPRTASILPTRPPSTNSSPPRRSSRFPASSTMPASPTTRLAVMMDQTKAEVAMQVNYWSFARIAGALVRPMMRAKDGRIVVIGSITALRANQGNAAYAASKAALLGYVRTLAIEIARTGVTVNYIAPGFIDTEMIAPYAKFREQMEGQIPARRFADPNEIAGVVAYLAVAVGVLHHRRGIAG